MRKQYSEDWARLFLEVHSGQEAMEKAHKNRTSRQVLGKNLPVRVVTMSVPEDIQTQLE